MTNNILYISDGSGGTPGQGSLAPLVQGQYGQDYVLEIRTPAGGVADLTGFSTITGHKIKGATVTSLVGTLTLSGSPAAAPQVTWVIDEDDTGEYGTFSLVIVLSDGTDNLRTIPTRLGIVRDYAVNDTPAAGLVGVTSAERALLTDMYTAAQAASSGEVYVFDGAGAGGDGGNVNMYDSVLTRPVLKDYGETVNAIGSTGGGTQDIDLTLGNVVSATVDTSANTFTFSNPSASGTLCSFTLFLTNGGSQTVNWPAAVKWAGGTAPTLTSSGVDILTFVTLNAGTTWYGFAAGLDMQ